MGQGGELTSVRESNQALKESKKAAKAFDLAAAIVAMNVAMVPDANGVIVWLGGGDKLGEHLPSLIYKLFRFAEDQAIAVPGLARSVTQLASGEPEEVAAAPDPDSSPSPGRPISPRTGKPMRTYTRRTEASAAAGVA